MHPLLQRISKPSKHIRDLKSDWIKYLPGYGLKYVIYHYYQLRECIIKSVNTEVWQLDYSSWKLRLDKELAAFYHFQPFLLFVPMCW